MNLTQQIRLLRYLVGAKVLTKVALNRFEGDAVKNSIKTREYRLNVEITREADGTTIQSIAWDWQSRDTGLPPRRHAVRQGAIHS